MAVVKIRRICYAETCDNWLSLVNSCIYSAHQSHCIYQALPYSADFKASGELWNPLRQYLGNVVLFVMKDL